MTKRIDYYFSLVSPWAYMGHAAFMEMVARYRLGVATGRRRSAGARRRAADAVKSDAA